MDDDQIPIGIITEELLPDDLRTELCIARITIADNHKLLKFRIDPGSAFERRAYLRAVDGARFLIGLSERYLPDDKLTHVCGSDGVPAADIPDQLCCLSAWAYASDADRDHWQDAFARREPTWTKYQKLITQATFMAETRAGMERVTHFLDGSPGRYRYGNNPPGPETAFFSVTPLGDWAHHDGTATYPLAAAPEATTIATLPGRTATRLARSDYAAAEPVVVPLIPRNQTAKTQATRNRRQR
ncbi:MAG TPA: hypothetical protein VN969_01535 [Streptosporangiaceae bacterium]|nr:hypothetical protein [Streptosporangiaceae bacterium]